MNMVLYNAAKLSLCKNDFGFIATLKVPSPDIVEIFRFLHAFKNNLNPNRVNWEKVKSKNGILLKDLNFANVDIDNLSENQMLAV